VHARKGSGHPNPEGVPADLIQAQLERIIASSAFDASRRNCAFLRFVVEETLAGRGDRIKAYTIGTGVLQRDAGFDPQTDPIVRIEARRLRRSLERYYLIAGKDDPIRIDIPKGGYVASFQRLLSAREDDGDTEAPELPQGEPRILAGDRAARRSHEGIRTFWCDCR
jgi:adenylate cyclase